MRKYSSGMRRSTMAELNITPLLDLAFNLLIIFMITTPLMEQTINIDLPESRPQETQQIDPKSVVAINIDSLGRIYLEKQQVSVQELETSLKSLKARDKDAAVDLRADENLKYQQLIKVLDAIRESGVKLGLATTPDDKL